MYNLVENGVSDERVGVCPGATRESQIEVLTLIFAGVFFHELSVGTCCKIVVEAVGVQTIV